MEYPHEVLPGEPGTVSTLEWMGCDATPWDVGGGVDETGAAPPDTSGWWRPSHLYDAPEPVQAWCENPEPEDADLEDYPEPLVVPPTHGGFLNDGSSGIDIGGYEFTAEYELAVHFALDECADGGINGGTCQLTMSMFDMRIHDIAMESGPLNFAATASLRLAAPISTTVLFDECVGSECEGVFEFSTTEENSVALGLVWQQMNTSTQHIAVAGFRISNNGDAIGSLDPLLGTITMNPTGDNGIIIFDGNGEDSLGGDFAEIWFGLYGYVERIDTDVGDCCSTHLTGGCSNDYIKACVFIHDPDCASVEWDAGCVAAVEEYHCGACP